jgi:hypothetical protein
MKELLLTLLHLAVMTAKLCGPGGVRTVIAENLLLKQQLIVLRRARQRAPNLALSDRLICGSGRSSSVQDESENVAIGVRPSTLLACHQALVRRKYQRLFSSSPCPRKPGPKGPSVYRVLTPLTFASGHTVARAKLNNVRWVSHCRDLVQLPAAA